MEAAPPSTLTQFLGALKNEAGLTEKVPNDEENGNSGWAGDCDEGESTLIQRAKQSVLFSHILE